MHRTLLACAALAAAAATSAQTLKPGLWEITNQMQGAAGSKPLRRRLKDADLTDRKSVV